MKGAHRAPAAGGPVALFMPYGWAKAHEELPFYIELGSKNNAVNGGAHLCVRPESRADT